MSYVGNTPADKFLTLEKQQFSVSATTGYTLSHSVSSPQDIALFINNVRQNPNSSYTVSGTTLTLSSATSSGDTMYCVFLGKAIGTVAPASSSVTNDMLSGSIATSKLADGSTFGQTNTPAFHATMSTQTLSNGSNTLLNFSTVVFDTNSNYDTTNKRFTPTVAGKYFINVSLLYSKASSVAGVQVRVRKNGSDAFRTLQAHFYGNDNQNYMASGIISCNGSGDYIDVSAQQDSGSSVNVDGSTTFTFFQGYKLIGA